MTLEQRLRRIVRGQIRSYFNDHPTDRIVMTNRNGKLIERLKRQFIESIAKRIVPDILAVAPSLRQVDGEVGTLCCAPSQAPASVRHGADAGQL